MSVRLPILSALCALGAIASCGAPEVRVDPPPTAALEVANLTEDTIRVSLGAEALGDVLPASRARFGGLPAREATFVVERAQGGFLMTITATLEAGKTSRVKVGRGRADPPAVSSVRVTSAQPVDLELRLDGKRVGLVVANGETTLEGIPAGSHVIEAVAASGPGFRVRVEVPSDEAARVAFDAAPASVVLDNDTADEQWIQIDGVDALRIDPGTRREGPLLVAGWHVVEARSLTTRAVLRRPLKLEPAQERVLRLGTSTGALVVVNRTGDDAAVELNGQALALLGVNERRRIDGLVPGVATWRLVSQRAGVVRGGEVFIGPGDIVTLEAGRGPGVLFVENRAGEGVALSLDGVVLKRLGSDAVVHLPHVPAGPHTLEARGERSGRVYRASAEITPASSTRILLTGSRTVLNVRNSLGESARLRIDTRDHGTLHPNESVVVTGLVPGPHVVALEGLDSGRKIERKITRLGDGSEAIDSRIEQARLRIVNESDEAMLPPPGLEKRLPRVDWGTERTIAIPSGNYGLTFRGEKSEFAYRFDVRVKDGEALIWKVARPTALLRVENRTSERMEVRSDGEVLVTLEPHKDATLANLRAGRHALTAVAERTRRELKAGVDLPAVGERAWILKLPPAALLIENRAVEDAKVFVDGHERAPIAPRRTHRYTDLGEGTHVVEVVLVRSKHVQRAEVTLVDGESRVWQVRASEGALRVLNPRSEVVRVSAGGEVRGEIPARGELTLTLPPGNITLDMTGVDSGRTRLFTGRLMPDQTIVVIAHDNTGPLIVANRSKEAVMIFREDAGLGLIAPGETRTFEGVDSGVALLRAEYRDGSASQRERLNIQPYGSAQPTRWLVAVQPRP